MKKTKKLRLSRDEEERIIGSIVGIHKIMTKKEGHPLKDLSREKTPSRSKKIVF
jgi:hypothetical protein